jgi:hypothetical protein
MNPLIPSRSIAPLAIAKACVQPEDYVLISEYHEPAMPSSWSIRAMMRPMPRVARDIRHATSSLMQALKVPVCQGR